MTSDIQPEMTAESPVAPHPLVATLYRMGGYALPFAIVFAGVVWGSVQFVLPRYSRIDVAGGQYSLQELPALKADLMTKIAAAENKRAALVTPARHATFNTLKKSRDGTRTFTVMTAIQKVIQDFSGAKDVVHVVQWQFDTPMQTLTLIGDVRNSGTQSMTVLAGFIDSLQKLPGVLSVSPVPYIRKSDSKIGDHSPFTVTLTLAQ